MKKDNILRILFLVLSFFVNGFIIWNSFVVGDKSAEMSNGIAEIIADGINSIFPGSIGESNFNSYALFVRKFIGHFCLFGLSGIISSISVYYCVKNTKFYYWIWMLVFSLIFGLIIASLSEFIQIFTLERVGSVTDLVIDFSGYILGFVFVGIILLINHSKIYKKSA